MSVSIITSIIPCDRYKVQTTKTVIKKNDSSEKNEFGNAQSLKKHKMSLSSLLRYRDANDWKSFELRICVPRQSVI